MPIRRLVRYSHRFTTEYAKKKIRVKKKSHKVVSYHHTVKCHATRFVFDPPSPAIMPVASPMTGACIMLTWRFHKLGFQGLNGNVTFATILRYSSSDYKYHCSNSSQMRLISWLWQTKEALRVQDDRIVVVVKGLREGERCGVDGAKNNM